MVGHAPEQRADAAVPGAWHVGRQPRARHDQCIVWEKLGTDNIPGNPWRGVPNYNGYQPDANGNLVYTEPNYLDVDKPFVRTTRPG